MESRFQRIFLVVFLWSWASTITWAQSDEENNEEEKTVLDAVIQPDIERRKIYEDKIDSEDFEMGMYSGIMSVEDFGSNDVYGLSLAYHITEDFFVEAVYGATKTSETSFETLSGSSDLLTEDERQLRYYNFSLGINLLPGEVFLFKNKAFNTSYYIIGGAGNTLFADDEYFTVNFGAGFRLFATDWFAVRTGFRNHIFTHNILGDDKSIQNLEAHMGLTIFF